jgi:hypothetical protein
MVNEHVRNVQKEVVEVELKQRRKGSRFLKSQISNSQQGVDGGQDQAVLNSNDQKRSMKLVRVGDGRQLDGLG